MEQQTAVQLCVEDLISSPALQLRLLAGASGLSRRVTWAHVSELADPTPWLLGGELVMTTGLAVPKTAAEQASYLTRLDDAGVAALALSQGLFVPPLTRAFLRVADERHMPVLEVPLPVPFIAISQEVAAALQSDTHRRLTAQLHVFGALRTLASEDVSVSDLFDRLAKLSGYSLFLCTKSGHPLLAGVPVPPTDLRARLPLEFDAPPGIEGGYVLPVPAPGGPAGFLVAIERDHVVSAGIAVVQHIATVAALQLAIHRHDEETLRREGVETLTEMLQGTLPAATTRRRLERLGFDLQAPLRLLVAKPVRPTSADVDLSGVVEGEGTVLILRQDRGVVALLSESALGALEARIDVATCAGVSHPFSAGEPLDVARREATWAAARAQGLGGGVVRFGDDAAGRWLAEDSNALRHMVGQVLGPALAYDDRHGSSLVPTVRVWLEHDRRAHDAAQMLRVHPNTLAYRLRRFEQLTGRSLQSTQGLAEVWLAMRAATSVETDAPRSGPD
jgi:PucR family transcriptional regulator, purine catabolism regulatory protein